jgi:hypothetical protein
VTVLEDEDSQGSPTGEAATSEEAAVAQPKRRGRLLIGCLVAILIAAIILILLFMRGCIPGRTSTTTTTQSATALADSAAQGIENKVHAAIHPLVLSTGAPLDNTVYIIEASRSNGTVVATIRLTDSTAALARTMGVGAAQRIATACENAVIAKVPEVATIRVVDADGVLVSATTRK